jgi:hypothetical protein
VASTVHFLKREIEGELAEGGPSMTGMSDENH